MEKFEIIVQHDEMIYNAQDQDTISKDKVTLSGQRSKVRKPHYLFEIALHKHV
jgi:hypothetical protein